MLAHIPAPLEVSYQLLLCETPLMVSIVQNSIVAFTFSRSSDLNPQSSTLHAFFPKISTFSLSRIVPRTGGRCESSYQSQWHHSLGFH